LYLYELVIGQSSWHVSGQYWHRWEPLQVFSHAGHRWSSNSTAEVERVDRSWSMSWAFFCGVAERVCLLMIWTRWKLLVFQV